MCQGHLLIDGSEKDTPSKIRKCTDLDEEVIKVLKEMKGEKKKSIRGDKWVEEQGLILFRGKVYVPSVRVTLSNILKWALCRFYKKFRVG